MHNSTRKICLKLLTLHITPNSTISENQPFQYVQDLSSSDESFSLSTDALMCWIFQIVNNSNVLHITVTALFDFLLILFNIPTDQWSVASLCLSLSVSTISTCTIQYLLVSPITFILSTPPSFLQIKM